MKLFIQFQSLMTSFLYALCLGLVYSFVNRCLYFLKLRWIRCILEIIFCSFLALIYFFIMLYVNNGHMNFYLIISFVSGLLIYEFVYASYFLRWFEQVMKMFHWLFSPVRFIFSKISGILKKKKKVMAKWRNKRKQQRKEKLIKEKSSQLE